MREERVRVLIVDGGGAGLTASMLLARQGVDHLLVNDRPSTSDLPKALGWRSVSGSEAPVEELSNALDRILARRRTGRSGVKAWSARST